MSWESLKRAMGLLEYPDNHNYDPETFGPHGKLARRLQFLQRNAPELWEKRPEGETRSLLEIGANKGYFCFALAHLYDQVAGTDKAPEYVTFCRKLQRAHGGRFNNVSFRYEEFRDIPFNKRYDVLYVANCHHYFFFDCVKSYAPPLLFLKKLAGLCNKYLIIDGPFETKDPAVEKLSREGAWSDHVKSYYTFEAHQSGLMPQFKLRRAADNGLGRTTAVFERVAPDVDPLDADDLRRMLIERAVPIRANPRRGPDSAFLYAGKRYKFDMNPVPDNVMLITNALKAYFPETYNVLMYHGARVGDCARWIDGGRIKDSKQLLHRILEINRVLGTVGLIQCDFEGSDFKYDGKRIYNVDIDLIRHVGEVDPVIHGEMPVHQLIHKKAAGRGMRPDAIEAMISNLGKKRVFDEIMREGNYYADD